MYFRLWLFHLEQQHCEQSILSNVHNFGMDICHPLNCLIVTRNTLPLSLFFRPSLQLSSSFPPLLIVLPSFLPYNYVSLAPSLSFFLFLSLFLPSSLPLYL